MYWINWDISKIVNFKPKHWEAWNVYSFLHLETEVVAEDSQAVGHDLAFEFPAPRQQHAGVDSGSYCSWKDKLHDSITNSFCMVKLQRIQSKNVAVVTFVPWCGNLHCVWMEVSSCDRRSFVQAVEGVQNSDSSCSADMLQKYVVSLDRSDYLRWEWEGRFMKWVDVVRTY